jgi:uncharacterized protein (DUF58 family)
MRGRRSLLGYDRRIDGFRFGDLSSRRRGIGMELDSIGPYQWGDDIRHMDWFATARTGRPQVKQFHHDVQQTVIVALDLRPHMVFGSSHHPMLKTACLAAAKIAWATSYDHQPFGLLLIGADAAMVVPPRRGRRARLQYLARIVESYHLGINDAGRSSPDLTNGMAALTAAMAGDVEAVVISDFSSLGDGFDRRLAEIGARGSTSAILIEDGLMQQAPPAGLYPLRSDDDPTLTTLAIRAGDENVYREHADDHRRRLTARLLSLGMRQVLISDPASIVEGYFR